MRFHKPAALAVVGLAIAGAGVAVGAAGTDKTAELAEQDRRVEAEERDPAGR